MIENPEGLAAAILRQKLGISTNQGFGPILSWMAQRAKKVGVSLQDVVGSQRKMANDAEITAFKAVPAFVKSLAMRKN